MQDPNWTPLVLAGAGTCLSFLAMLVVSLIGFFVRFVLSENSRRLQHLEAKAETHSADIASAKTQTASETESLKSLWSAVESLRGQFTGFEKSLSEILGHLRRNGSITPTKVQRVDPRAERG